MTAGQVFVDTNILIYALDASAGSKHARAEQVMALLWGSDTLPSISVQVLQELYRNLLRKGVSEADASKAVRVHLAWNVVVNDPPLLLAGIDASQRWQLSLWDGLIIAAARQAHATTLLTEDLNDGQDYGGVRAVNPFKHDVELV